MTALEVVLGLVGLTVTALVVTGMVLLTPRGQVDLREETLERQGSELSRAEFSSSER
jgi:uncharacterized iron-regulated membrane protein